MPSLPSPVRAALGLAATLLDEAKTLPDKAIELPMLAVSKTLQMSLRAQQRYSALEARGDEVLSGRQTTDEPPEWARFDSPVGDGTDGDATHGDATHGDGTDGAAGDAVVDPTAVADAPAGEAAKAHKKVNAPRNGAPSAFDAVVDD